MSSIRQKITFGYYLFAASIVSLAIFAYLDLRLMEQRLTWSTTVSGLFDKVLEMRRFEKNYFLYGGAADLQAAHNYASEATTLLRQQRAIFVDVASNAEQEQLLEQLQQYQRHVEAFLATNREVPGEHAPQKLRELGHRISAMAETINTRQHVSLRKSLSEARNTLLLWLSAITAFSILLGQLLARAVIRPLHRLEEDLKPIGEGVFDKLEPHSNDREITSFTTAFNHMLHELELRRRHLLQSEKLASLGTLVSGVAHELNNPLSNISSSCQLLLEELDEAGKQQLREWLKDIDDETERARNIVHALLDFSREQPFQRQPMVLQEIVDKAQALVRRQLPPKVHSRTEIPPQLSIDADPQRLQQVFVNLLKNAGDAGGDNIVIHATTNPAECPVSFSEIVWARDPCIDCQKSGAVYISVCDNGGGIPQTILQKIFDPFFTTKDVGHGSGIGLYVAQDIINQHDGCLGAANQTHGGACFIMMLPASPGEQRHED